MASPALWTARFVLASALCLGVAWIVASPQAQPPRPKPIRIALPPRPASKPTPSPKATPFVLRRVLDTGGPIRYGAWFWDEQDVPAGPTLITIDLEANVLSIFRGGYEIGTAAIIYGADEKPTPLGTFPILQKDAKHWSNLYDAPMPYMLRLTNDGVSIHASRVSFDGATHGCIGIPEAFARKLFAAAKLGDPVVVTRGKTMTGA